MSRAPVVVNPTKLDDDEARVSSSVSGGWFVSGCGWRRGQGLRRVRL